MKSANYAHIIQKRMKCKELAKKIKEEKVHISIVLFGFYEANNETGYISSSQIQQLRDMITAYSHDVVFNILIIGRMTYAIDNSDTENFYGIGNGICVNYYYIDERDIFELMDKYNYGFMCFTHRLYAFNTVSYLMSLNYCGNMLRKNKELIKNDRVFFSRIDTFMRNINNVCNYLVDLKRNNIHDPSILRDENVVEDRYFVIDKSSLIEMLSSSDIIKFASYQALNNHIRNYPEAILYDYYTKNKVIDNKYFFNKTLITDISVNWHKYSYENFDIQFQKYTKYVQSTQRPFILHSVDNKLPCFHIGINSGLCITSDWERTYVGHCVTFDIMKRTKNVVCRDLLFHSNLAFVRIINYNDIYVTLRDEHDGKKIKPCVSSTESDLDVSVNLYIPVLRIKSPNILSSTKDKYITIQINNQLECDYSLFKVVDKMNGNTTFMSQVNKLNDIYTHFVSIKLPRYAEKSSTGELEIHPFDIHILNHADLLGKKLDINIINDKVESSSELQPCYNIPSCEKIAMLIIGYDRFWDVPTQKSMWCDIIRNLNADLFIVSYERCFDDLERLFPKNVKIIRRRNCDEYKKQMRSFLSTVGHPQPNDYHLNVFLQYKNLEDCFDDMVSFENSINIKYKYVFKMRPDLRLSNFNWNFDSFVKPSNVYMESDYMFYGMRDEMDIICHLFSAKFSFYDKTSWDKRPISYDILLKSLENNPAYIFDMNRWNPELFKNKFPAIPIPIIPYDKYGGLLWENNPREYFLNMCKYFLEGEGARLKNDTKMTSLTLYDREPNLFQCEYFIIDWAMRNNIVVCEPNFFKLQFIMRA